VFSDGNSILGGLQWMGLRGVGLMPNSDYAATIPHQAFMIFQMMFAIITPALMTGAFAERMKFSTFLVFSFVWPLSMTRLPTGCGATEAGFTI
jgi:Amt family ammonium transporter